MARSNLNQTEKWWTPLLTPCVALHSGFVPRFWKVVGAEPEGLNGPEPFKPFLSAPFHFCQEQKAGIQTLSGSQNYTNWLGL